MNRGYTPELRSFDELFGSSTDEVHDISLDSVDEFPGHPFKVINDNEMQKLVESISRIGITTPLLVRQSGDRYELVSGHRRMHAANVLGLTTVPAIIKNMSDEEATIAMVDSNNQRSKWLPSEKAKSYKMKYDAIKHQGVAGENSLEEMSRYFSEGTKTVQRFISIADMAPEMLQLLDDHKIGFTIAVTLADINEEDQKMLATMISSKGIIINGKMARAIKSLSENNNLTETAVTELVNHFNETKLMKSSNPYSRFFPEGTSYDEMDRIIISLLEQYKSQYQN